MTFNMLLCTWKVLRVEVEIRRQNRNRDYKEYHHQITDGIDDKKLDKSTFTHRGCDYL